MCNLVVDTTMYVSTLYLLLSIICVRAEQVEVVTMTTVENVTGCVPPVLTDHTELIPHLATYPVNFTVTVSCVNQSVLVGESAVLQCLETGDWDKNTTYCTRIDCITPVLPVNSTRTFHKNSETSQIIAKYSCKDKYELVGRAISKCEPDGNWTEPVPTCSSTCLPAVVPLNGSVHMECSYQNCTAFFMCHEGYTLVGDKRSLCLDGVWVHTNIPKCEKTYCPAPPQVNNTVSNINISQENFPYGATVTFTCLYNFTLYGNASLRCGMHGHWLGLVPHCLVSAHMPTTDVETTDARFTSTTQAISTVSINSTNCLPPPPLEHGQYLVYDVHTLLYKCDYGFTLHGQKERRCEQNLTWSHEAPICKPDPPSDETSTVSESVHLTRQWKAVFLEYREWEGTYVYWEKPTRFKLWVLENKHPDTDRIEVLFIDNEEAKLHVIVGYDGTSLKFEMTRLIEKSERFLPGNAWAFEGYLRKHHNHWQFIASAFHSQPGFEKLRMSPKKDYSPPPLPNFTEADSGRGEPSLKVVALALGIIIAVVAILFAATLAAFLVRRKAMKAAGHRSVTSFENPVYEYQNGLKLPEHYQEPTDC